MASPASSDLRKSLSAIKAMAARDLRSCATQVQEYAAAVHVVPCISSVVGWFARVFGSRVRAVPCFCHSNVSASHTFPFMRRPATAMGAERRCGMLALRACSRCMECVPWLSLGDLVPYFLTLSSWVRRHQEVPNQRPYQRALAGELSQVAAVLLVPLQRREAILRVQKKPRDLGEGAAGGLGGVGDGAKDSSGGGGGAATPRCSSTDLMQSIVMQRARHAVEQRGSWIHGRFAHTQAAVAVHMGGELLQPAACPQAMPSNVASHAGLLRCYATQHPLPDQQAGQRCRAVTPTAPAPGWNNCKRPLCELYRR